MKAGLTGDLAMRAHDLEVETQRKVSVSLSKIDVALAEWDAAKTKPKRLGRRIEYLRLSQSLLSRWARDSIKGMRDEESTLARLAGFVALCERLDAERSKLHGRREA